MELSKPGIYVAVWIAMIASVLVLAGCGGSDDDNHYYYTGTIYGVKVTPQDGSIGVDVGEDVYVSWPESGYPEPDSFTFKMEEENSSGGWTGVYTQDVGSSYISGVETWRFRPINYLTYNTWFKVTLTDNTGRKEIIMFKSEAVSGVYSSSKAPSSKTDARGAIEHTITTKK